MNPRDRIRLLGAGLAGLGAAPAALAQGQTTAPLKPISSQPWKVVLQISVDLQQAYEGLINVQNVLQLDPRMQFVVVGYGKAIHFLLNGAKAPTGAAFSGMIGALANQGVQFKACLNTMHFLKIPTSELVLEASTVPAGVYEIIRLQSEGWYYLKP